MVRVGPRGPVNVCCGAHLGHRVDCPELMAALIDDDRRWLGEHGWCDPDEMAVGEAFLGRYFRPELLSSDGRVTATPPADIARHVEGLLVWDEG